MAPDLFLPGLWTVAALVGLVFGSFLNVVIHRLPRMLEREWQAGHEDPSTSSGVYNLAFPASHCPLCNHPLSWYENLPVISFVWLRGRCRHCQAPISWQYPAVELAVAAIFAWHFSRYGWSAQAWVWAGFASVLLALAVIDAQTTLLPDALTQPLTWAGLLAAAIGYSGLRLPDALWGAVGGYLFLWSVYWLFRWVTGKDGMGQGDFKLLAALGSWFGWQALLALILLASLSGLAAGLWLRWRQRLSADTHMPFGPCLALAGLILMMGGTPSWLAL